MEEATFFTHIKGMYCRQCPEILTEQLMQTRGVIDCRVEYLKAALTVQYDPGIITEAALREKLALIGYSPCKKGAPGSNPILNALLHPFQ